MIQGFEEETKPLTDYEMRYLLPKVVCGMNNHCGKSRAITGKSICEALTKKGLKIDGARLRKIMNHIRNNALVGGVLVANNRGYYVSDDVNAIAKYIKSLEGRAMAMLAVKAKLEKQILNR